MVTGTLPLVCFIFPFRGVGGVSMLFLRMASYLAEAGLARTCVVDYSDGFMALHRDTSLCSLLEYRDDEPVSIPDQAIAVFQSMTPWSIFPSLRLQDSTRVFFWNCHPFNLVPLAPGLRVLMQNHALIGGILLSTVLLPYKRRMRRFVRILMAHRALVFMDSENKRVTARYLGTRSLPEYCLPIPVDTRLVSFSCDISARNMQEAGLRILWMGRVVDFKFHILYRALERMNSFQPSLGVPLDITIIGRGEYAQSLRKATRKFINISVHFLEELKPEQVDSYFLEKADMVMAMGTSALDAGRLGIPTLLLDYSYKPVDMHYRFKWLHERDGYTLADQIRDCHLQDTDDSMLTRLQEILTQSSSLGTQARLYVEKHHSLHEVGPKLMELLRRSDCDWQYLRKARVLDRGILYEIFSRLRRTTSNCSSWARCNK